MDQAKIASALLASPCSKEAAWDASTSKAADHAPSITVFTNLAGAVAVTVDRDSNTSAGRRLSSKPLPENVFNPFRECRSKRREPVTPKGRRSVGDNAAASEAAAENPHVASAAAAAIAVEGIKKGVRDALDRWALQTSRRESMVLWRHECSRYASSSRIGYHPNHPSASHPSSRPSSAATILRPFSAGRVPQQSSKQQQHHQQQRASSALPRRPVSHQEGGGESGASWDAYEADGGSGLPAAREYGGRARGSNRNRPRSAIPRLGAGAGGGTDDADELLVAGPRPDRGYSASAARGESGVGEGEGLLATGGRRSRSTSARSRSPMDRRTTNLVHEEGEGEDGDEFLDEIYEDLDDEDDGELDNRISIMESRFSTVGRERPDSAVGDGSAISGSDPVGATHQRQRRSDPQRVTASAGVPRSATSQRPPRAPLQQQQRQVSAGSRTTRRHLTSDSARTGDGAETGEDGHSGTTQQLYPSHPAIAIRDSTRPPRVIRSRPTSAPVDGSMFDQDQRSGHGGHDPMAPLHARWRRLQMSAGARNGDGRAAGVGHGPQQRARPVREVTTAVPSWDRDGGNNRPLSSATEGAPGTAAAAAGGSGGADDGVAPHQTPSDSVSTPANSRPSSAAFRSWMKARPGARSAVSAVSSARTLGMDDPELAHLQLEMESRRGGLSEAALARMEDHYTAVALKNSNQSLPRGRPASPRKKGGSGGRSPRKRRGSSKGSRKGGSKKKSKSKSPTSKGRKKKGKKGTREGGGGAGKQRGGGAGEPSAATKKVYASAGAFMAEHFPSEGRQGVSLLGMEQEEECQYASEALSRAGVSVSSSALRRALVIPTDRPIETCLAGLPAPLDGLRDAPYPAPPPPLRLPTAAAITAGHRYPPSSSFSSPGLSGANAVGLVMGAAAPTVLSNKAGARKRSPSPGRRGVAGGRGRSPAGGGGRGRKKTGLRRR